MKNSISHLAHVRQDESGRFVVHDLAEHLSGVADKSSAYASVFGNSDWAYLAGLWHDLGKYSEAFQKRIKTLSGFDTEAHLEGKAQRVDHSTAGAIHAVNELGPHGIVLAYLIAGHHAGLADWYGTQSGSAALSVRLENRKLLDDALAGLPPEEILKRTKPVSKPPAGSSPALWLRMLFSCLVDADFCDTEAFMDPDKAALRSVWPSLAGLSDKFTKYMRAKTAQAPKTRVNQLRAEVLQQCTEKAVLSPGLFSLTVPTGGGKTLSSMAFALNHAFRHGKERIVYVIPYTSIIEQTADEFRKIFGSAVVEHHSNLDPESETPKSRLACENWDAPIIVTTNVQFFESLFAARTSQTRKLHHIANSVVILDEAQLLPADFLQPILHVVRNLSYFYKVTFLLCTATQPALEERRGFDWHFPGLTNVRELMANPDDLHARLKRVEVAIPRDFTVPREWAEIADELQQYPSVLCVVNRRDDCRLLHRLMPKGTIHLSALMCGEHRSRIIEDIKSRLKKREPVRVISTQLVEAGVDVDFPVVYRAMAGLDSIAQAAGRCNREGLLDGGKVVVFVPPKPAPRGLLQKAEDTAKQMLQQGMTDPLSPGACKKFFEQLYWKMNNLDRHGIIELLEKDGHALKIQFRTAAEKFELIDNKQQASVIVLYGESEKWIAMLRKNGPERWLMRKLQRYTVTIPRAMHDKMTALGEIHEAHPGIFVQTYPALYNAELGFLAGETGLIDPADYVC